MSLLLLFDMFFRYIFRGCSRRSTVPPFAQPPLLTCFSLWDNSDKHVNAPFPPPIYLFSLSLPLSFNLFRWVLPRMRCLRQSGISSFDWTGPSIIIFFSVVFLFDRECWRISLQKLPYCNLSLWTRYLAPLSYRPREIIPVPCPNLRA